MLSEGRFDLHWINFRLKKTLIILFLNDVPLTISLLIPPITKSTSLVNNVSINNLFQLLPNSNIPSSQDYRQKLVNLTKIYIYKANYSGKNNSFLFKLTIFRDIYDRANIPQEILLKSFSTILTGLALDYYYWNTSIKTTVIFDKVCESIQIYFKRAKYKRRVLSKWNIRILKSIIEKNEGKSIK